MTTPAKALPMVDGSTVLSPCVVCRRRLRVHGKPVFSSCMCLSSGRHATVAYLTMTAILFAGLALAVAKAERR